jgi:FAD/FMN-containing dehydrogenase
VVEKKMSSGIFWRDDTGYEHARLSAVSNGRKPDRFPDVIVRAQCNDDVVAAVQLAKERNLKIGIRSGGHSWAASFLRDGGMLLDLAQMNSFSVDVSTRTATIQPALKGSDLNRALLKDRLFFPSGHCMPVSLGGFLLQGGFGWNSRLCGPACCSILGMDIVTADGELVHANESENADLFWAARGAGPGFFGVVTRFHLALYPRPQAMMKSDYVYPIEVLDDVLRWIRTIQPSLPPNMEPLVFVRRDMFGHSGPMALVTAPAMADSQEEARAALALLETHYAADNMWTNASADALLPGIRKIAETLPPAPSHMMWMLWGPTQPRPAMSFSMESDLYIALYGISHNATGEATSQAWVTERMRELENLADGIQLADENLGARPFRFLRHPNFQRLQAIRSERDPDGMFHSYMALPLE